MVWKDLHSIKIFIIWHTNPNLFARVRFIEFEFMQVIIQPTHYILNCHMQIPKTVSPRNAYPPPDEWINPNQNYQKLKNDFFTFCAARFTHDCPFVLANELRIDAARSRHIIQG